MTIIITRDGTRQRITPAQRDILIALLDKPCYPGSGNERRTYDHLLEMDLVTPLVEDRYALTSDGWKVAISLMERYGK